MNSTQSQNDSDSSNKLLEALVIALLSAITFTRIRSPTIVVVIDAWQVSRIVLLSRQKRRTEQQNATVPKITLSSRQIIRTSQILCSFQPRIVYKRARRLFISLLLLKFQRRSISSAFIKSAFQSIYIYTRIYVQPERKHIMYTLVFCRVCAVLCRYSCLY